MVLFTPSCQERVGPRDTCVRPVPRTRTGSDMSASSRAYPLIVGVVGAGRVGAVLGAALTAVGHRVVAVAAVSAASRERAARLLPQAAVLPADEVARVAT